MTPHEVLTMLLGLGILLGLARMFGELAKRFGQPSVLGEILAGIVLGPSILGHVSPDLMNGLFPRTGANAIAIDAFSQLAMVLFLLVAGMEVDLSLMRKQGKTALSACATGKLFTFALAFTVALSAPTLLDAPESVGIMPFAFFYATALSVVALPVIAKTLMDLALYRSDFGMTVIAAAILHDVISWILFAFTLSIVGTNVSHGFSPFMVCILTALYLAGMLTIGRWAIDKSVPWIQAHTSWPGGILGFSVAFALLSSALTEWFGVHAVFGAFIAGLAIGDSPHLRQHTRTIINDFVSFIFAPIFFASVGLKVNFVTDFDPMLTGIVLFTAMAGMIPGSFIGARLTGMQRRESLALGFALNSRGAMEIIIGLLGLQYGLITKPMFVAFVIVALGTAIVSGPMIQFFLESTRPKRFKDALNAKAFVGELDAVDRRSAIEKLAQAVAPNTNLNVQAIINAVWSREELMPTGLGHGVAVPHARMAGIKTPVVAVGFSRGGIDFDAFDGEPAHLILLLLTPQEDSRAQLELLADIGRCFAHGDNVRKAIQISNYTEFRALLNTQGV